MTLAQAAFNYVAVNSTALGGVTNPHLDRREKQKPLENSGNIHQTGSSVISAAPMFSFTTIAVRALVTLIGTSAQLPFLALDGSNGVQLIGLVPALAGPGYASGSVHPQQQAVAGDLYIKALRWSIGEVLTADVEGFPIDASGDGADDPFDGTLVAAPATVLNAEQLTLGGVTANGTAVNGITSIELSVGHKGENNEPEICNNSGLPFPVVTKKAGIGGSSEIILTIETTDMAASLSGVVVLTFYVLNPLGVGQGSTGITLSLSGTIIRPVDFKGSDGQAGKRQLSVRATYNGSTKPLTLATF